MPAPTPRRAGRRPPEGARARFVEDVLAANVRGFRLLRDLEQADVAERMNNLGHRWTPATVSEVERGRRNVTVPELLALVLALQASVDQLLDPRGPERRSGPDLILAATSDDESYVTLGDEDPRVVPARDVNALVCSHRTLAIVSWHGARRYGWRLQAVEYHDGRPDLTDVEMPEEERQP